MSRTEKQTPAEHIAASRASEFIADTANNTQALTVLTNQINAETNALAAQLGYDGDLSIGSLEDGIRFYQRRTVEACLELGKRLVLLKSVTPVGEFTKRVELMGFHERAARRFMNAAIRTSGSDNLSALSTRVKSASAFLELVMVDDEDTLKTISELDDVDRMSAGALRKEVRELTANKVANDRLIAEKDKRINELKRKGQTVAFTDGCHVFSALIEQIDKERRQLNLTLSELDEHISAALATEIEEVDMPAAAHAYAALAQAINDALTEPQAKIDKATKRFETFISPLADAALAA